MFKHHHAMFFCPRFSIFPCLFCFTSFGFFYFDFIKIQCKEFIYFPFMLFNPPPAPTIHSILKKNSSRRRSIFQMENEMKCLQAELYAYLFIYFLYIRGYPLRMFLFFSFRFSINNSQKFYHFSAKFISFFNRCSVFLDSMVFTSH